MKPKAEAEGRRWLEQAEADSIPARVYTRAAAEETLRMADHVLDVVRQKLGAGIQA